MKLKMLHTVIPVLSLSALLFSCDKKETVAKPPVTGSDPAATEEEHDHAHDEVSLGTFTAGDMEIEASQGHGMIEAGKEGHLVIKLPYKDDGSTVVRAWIGTDDRTLSAVGKGEYAPSHDDYDIHAIAPTPLPTDAQWWVEVEKPDGTKAVGSIAPKL